MNQHTKTTTKHLQTSLEKAISERGFFLYEWITPKEFYTSIRADYLQDIQSLAKPLFWGMVATGIISYIFSENIVVTIVYIVGITLFFYSLLFLKLFIVSCRKGIIFSKFGNISITDEYIISGENILRHNEKEARSELFAQTEKYFHEPFLGNSLLEQHIETQHKGAGEIIGEILQKVGNIRQERKGRKDGGLMIIIFLATAIFLFLLAVSYFIILPFVIVVSIGLTKIFTKILHLKNATEYKIHHLFEDINQNANKLVTEKATLITFLQHAQENQWMDNLSGKLTHTFQKVNTIAENATNQSISLKETLQNSKYHNIFHFEKLHSWLKNQLLEPISEIIQLCQKNEKILSEMIQSLDTQINNTTEISHKKPLELQKTRGEMKITEMRQMIEVLQKYQTILQQGIWKK